MTMAPHKQIFKYFLQGPRKQNIKNDIIVGKMFVLLQNSFVEILPCQKFWEDI